MKENRKSYWKTTMAAGFGFALSSGLAGLMVTLQGSWAGSEDVVSVLFSIVLWGVAILCSLAGLLALFVLLGGLLSLYCDAKGLTG